MSPPGRRRWPILVSGPWFVGWWYARSPLAEALGLELGSDIAHWSAANLGFALLINFLVMPGPLLIGFLASVSAGHQRPTERNGWWITVHLVPLVIWWFTQAWSIVSNVIG